MRHHLSARGRARHRMRARRRSADGTWIHTDPHTAELLALALQIMRESGDDAPGFDARAWLAHWLRSPVPALGGTPPDGAAGRRQWARPRATAPAPHAEWRVQLGPPAAVLVAVLPTTWLCAYVGQTRHGLPAARRNAHGRHDEMAEPVLWRKSTDERVCTYATRSVSIAELIGRPTLREPNAPATLRVVRARDTQLTPAPGVQTRRGDTEYAPSLAPGPV